MNFPPYIGLTGAKTAGKDTVCERMIQLAGERIKRFSVADPLKDCAAALLDLSLGDIERLKNDEHCVVAIRTGADDKIDFQAPMTFRRFLERLGTESHRDVFGQDFWLDFWKTTAQRMHLEAGGSQPWLHLTGAPSITVVNTSVRFDNEAEWILDHGGWIIRVEGPPEVEEAAANARREDGTPVPSETPLPDHLITQTIDNAPRNVLVTFADDGSIHHAEPDFSHLDDQIATLFASGGTAT